jgi:hypothetical protein
MGDQPISERRNTYWITINKIGKATLSLTLAKCTQNQPSLNYKVLPTQKLFYFSLRIFFIAQIRVFSTAGRVVFRVTSYQLWLSDCEQDLGNSAVSDFMKTPPAVLELLQVDRQTNRQTNRQTCCFSQFSLRKGYSTINARTNLRRFVVVVVFP